MKLSLLTRLALWTLGAIASPVEFESRIGTPVCCVLVYGTTACACEASRQNLCNVACGANGP